MHANVTVPPAEIRGFGAVEVPSLDKRKANLVRALAQVRAQIAHLLEREGNLVASLEAIEKEEASCP